MWLKKTHPCADVYTAEPRHGTNWSSKLVHRCSFDAIKVPNKWSKNFDERPHRPRTYVPMTGEPILKPCFRGQFCSPVMLRRSLLTQSNAFQ